MKQDTDFVLDGARLLPLSTPSGRIDEGARGQEEKGVEGYANSSFR